MIQEPLLLFRAEKRLRRSILLSVRHLLIAKWNRLRRFAAVIFTPSVNDLQDLFRNELSEILVEESVVRDVRSRSLGAVASLVGDDQFHMPPPAQRPVSFEAVDRYEIIRFLSETVVVKFRYRDISDFGRIETFKGRTAGLRHPRQLILKKRLHGRHLARLRRTRFAVENLQRLPSLPTELVVIPHRNKRPPRPGVLEIRIVQVVAVDSSIVIYIHRDVKVVDLFTFRIANDVPNMAIVVGGPVLRIPD